ncbi:Folate-Biopterin Transporter [Phytophthora megakarya]|uniref:Folate-Biopterin Transporter n=1 Tax=Phytophthora megakarya TaxID=4795 RepID=A0A225UPK7_9STRA|nr:Folate-Biopterin Transporter [Phytophthora megakarya]
MFGIMITSKWGLHWNWRWMIVITGAVVIVVDCTVSMLVVWDIFRNQWFWLGPPIAVQLPYGVGWIISTFITVGLAGLGNEAAVYGLITTVTNVAVWSVMTNIMAIFTSTACLVLAGGTGC